MSWKEFLQLIRDKHAAIEQHFQSGIGLRLQCLDSRIAEGVMLRFAEMGAACLPVHDSFIVHHGYEQDLKRIMREEYIRVMGQESKVPDEPEEQDFEIEEAPSDLDDLLQLLDQASWYEDRREAWFRERSSVRIHAL
jgi:hypothetical protein